MKQYQFQQIRDMISNMWASPEEKQNDDWWMITWCITEFNQNRKKQVNASFMKVMDESMSAFHPQTWVTGNLPHLSFILRKPENLGTEFKVMACPITGIILFLEIQKGRESNNATGTLFKPMWCHCGLCAMTCWRVDESSTRIKHTTIIFWRLVVCVCNLCYRAMETFQYSVSWRCKNKSHQISKAVHRIHHEKLACQIPYCSGGVIRRWCWLASNWLQVQHQKGPVFRFNKNCRFDRASMLLRSTLDGSKWKHESTCS